MQVRAMRTCRAILESATNLFAERGYAGTSIDAIAEAAEVNKQRIYAYFGSKQGLFGAALTACFNSGAEFCPNFALDEAREHPERLTAILLKAFLKQHESDPRFGRLLAWANLESGMNLEMLSGVRRRDNAAIREVFELARERGYFPEVSFESYLFALFAVTYFYIANRRTLKYSLGEELFGDGGEAKLLAELTHVFR